MVCLLNRRTLIIIAGLPLISYCQPDIPSCFVDLPIYDGTGKRLAFRIIELRPIHGDDASSIKDVIIDNAILSVARLRFPKERIGSAVEIVFGNGVRSKFIQRIELRSCEQRTSLRYGNRGVGGDVLGTTITGRIVGCNLVGDWWIRAMPMFGVHQDIFPFEGRVNKLSGAFRLTGTLDGERHILIIGRQRDPVKAVAVDVVEGGENDVGVIDLSAVCSNNSKSSSGR